ncbi:MAG: OmpA family protein [Polyangiaceae bacterium]|nr:OmpA family protein [Polyangiaceae bacterium]
MARSTASHVILVGSACALTIAAGCTVTVNKGPNTATATDTTTATATATAAPTVTPAPTATAEPAPTTTATAEKPDKKYSVDKDGRVNIPGNIVFAKDSAKIEESDAGTQEVLRQLKLFCDENPRVTKIRIEGHTDNDGDAAHNMQLSGERARAVKTWLVNAGVKPERLVAVGFGENAPIADNATAEGKAQNRRTEFHKAELDGRPYMGRPVLGKPGGQVFE